MAQKSYDIVIVGAGFAGLLCACLLGQAGLSVACIDQKTSIASNDLRTTAISYGSSKILEKASVKIPEGCPINQIDILDGDDVDPRLVFTNQSLAGKPFGWIMDNTAILNALYNRALSFKHVDILWGTSETPPHKLLIAADGRGSRIRDQLKIPVRSWSYKQTAIVGVVEHEHHHNNIAVEHFRSSGPFAILPIAGGHHSSIVWSVDKMMDMDLLPVALAARFPARYGKIKNITRVQSFPLSLMSAARMIGPRTALVADAAHAIHPIAGQGLNLGLRDCDVLSDIVIDAHKRGHDIGSDIVLNNYQQARRFDNFSMIAATDKLNWLFGNKNPLLSIVRKIGLSGVQKSATAKNFFILNAMGLQDAA